MAKQLLPPQTITTYRPPLMLARLALATLCLLLTMPEFLPLTGYMSRYDQTPTDATIHYRQSVGDIPEDLAPFAGVIAVENCAHIGKTAFLDIDGHPQHYRVMIFDCLGGNIGYNWMQGSSIILELGFYLHRDLVAEGFNLSSTNISGKSHLVVLE